MGAPYKRTEQESRVVLMLKQSTGAINRGHIDIVMSMDSGCSRSTEQFENYHLNDGRPEHPTEMRMSSTRVTRYVKAPRAIVYAALLDAQAVTTWKVPKGMTSDVHAFEAREGGAFRISLTYAAPNNAGKTSAHTDTYHGHFVKLVPNEQVVEKTEFETSNPAMQGEMTITTTLRDVDGGTEVIGLHEGLPPGVTVADNELGWRESLARLAELVEGGWKPGA